MVIFNSCLMLFVCLGKWILNPWIPMTALGVSTAIKVHPNTDGLRGKIPIENGWELGVSPWLWKQVVSYFASQKQVHDSSSKFEVHMFKLHIFYVNSCLENIVIFTIPQSSLPFWNRWYFCPVPVVDWVVYGIVLPPWGPHMNEGITIHWTRYDFRYLGEQVIAIFQGIIRTMNQRFSVKKTGVSFCGGMGNSRKIFTLPISLMKTIGNHLYIYTYIYIYINYNGWHLTNDGVI